MKRFLAFVLIFALAVPTMASAATRAPAPRAAPRAAPVEGEAGSAPAEVTQIAAPRPAPIIIDHNNVNIGSVPQEWIEAAKNTLHIAYGHTSHGSQLISGMNGLVDFANGGGRGLDLPDDIFAWNNGGTNGALDLHDGAMGGDVGYYPEWVNNTQSYLGTPNAAGRGSSNPDVNVIMWSWCGQASVRTEQTMLDTYLLPMTQLEADYPGITFVYMTGHSDGGGLEGNLHLRNQQIRNYCIANNKVLFDFYDIELYDPDEAYYGDKAVNDNCDYDSDGNGSRDKNWALDWQGAHTVDVDWYDCGCAHSQSLNCNQKGYAIWWLWAKLAGWGGASAGRHYVAPGGACGGQTPCYGSVQAAVNAAQDGEEILVAGGVYTHTTAPVASITKTVTLRGGYNADFSAQDPVARPTTLDARGQEGPVLSITGDISPTIEGLRITGGSDTTSWGCGGICVISATATISRCHVFSNLSSGIALDHSRATLLGNTIVSNTTASFGFGGGVVARYSEATLTGNTVSANSAGFDGGGLALASGSYTLSDNTISGNTASDDGGGVYLYDSQAELEGNVISANSATSTGGGLAAMMTTSSFITLSHNTLSNNTAGFGGGLMLNVSKATLDANMISANSAAFMGGGLLLGGGAVASTNDVIVDNQASNDGSGLCIDGSAAHLLHTTIARNALTPSRRAPSADGQASGIYVDNSSPGSSSSVLMTNTILVSHTVGISVTGGNTVSANGMLWHDTPITVSQSTTATVVVQNQHSGSPAFAADGYHLTGSSAAINAGVPSGVTGEASHDIDGEPRFDGRPDLGADEALADLEITKQATPNPAQPGGQLTYTIRIANTGVVTLHATMTDTLPIQVMAGTTPGGTAFVPGGTIVWPGLTIAPGATWAESFTVTLESGYFGPLINTVQVTSLEAASGSASTASVVGGRIYLPVILRQA